MEKEVALKEGVRNVRKNKAVLNTGSMGLQMAEGGVRWGAGGNVTEGKEAWSKEKPGCLGGAGGQSLL